MRDSDFSTDLCKSGHIIELMRPITKVMNKSGFFYRIRFDMDGWVKARAKMDPHHKIVMPTFNPAECDQSRSYWIEATKECGDVCGIIAARRFDTSNFVELMKTGKVWADNPSHNRLHLSLPKDFSMQGSILYRGGLCIKKQHRKTGLSWALPRLVSLFSIDQGIDYTVSHNLADLHGNGFSFRVYGHSGSVLCFDGSEYFPPTRDKRPAFLVWTDLKSSINNARRDHEIIIRRSNQNLYNLALLAQGPNEMKITSGFPRNDLLNTRKSG